MNTGTNGKLITFEGCEGAGKTTVIERVFEWLVSKGYKVMKTREPGGIEIAEQIRSVILDPGHVNMDSRTEALLYAAARRQHLIEKIMPALEEGHIVLCDRFIDSSLAYQGAARGIGMDQVLEINKFAIGPYMPTGTIYLDIKPEIGLQRIRQNDNREINRLDQEKMEFHEKVYNAYHELLEQYPERIHKINAENTLEQVIEETKQHVSNILLKELRL
ncbi:dTMP kinase [Alteribacillus iranensis]|uniref:Thymidylate kinase n=1 Tax=Alteribacillus iranensis TaxID=930128 RepID=A0A1I2FEE8_9BACI|nr:dTMP kinase [Alteribacillus iranensis]SFF03118.1 thymidylate kinase [Alteribacillus iranensis]